MATDEKLLQFLYACPVGLIEFDGAGEISMINPHAMQHLMPLAGAAACVNFFAAMENFAPELRSIAGNFPGSHGTIRDHHRIFVDLAERRRKGRPQVLSCSLVKLGPDRFMATLGDITDEVTREHRLRQADTWFSALIDGINDFGVVVVSGDLTVISANASFLRQSRRGFDTVIGHSVKDILVHSGENEPGAESVEDQFGVAARDGWHLHEGWEQRADGERYWCQRLIVVRDDDETPQDTTFSMVMRDVPPRETDSGDLITMLTRDDLTGASNRMYFHKTLRREKLRWQNRREPLSLVMLDLDHFKAVNDSYGHPGGDAVLCAVARTGLAMKPANAVFARLGGEEFALLLPGQGIDGAMRIASALREAIARTPVETTRGEIRVTASMGCAELDEVDGSTDDLIELADARLYQAKRSGRNRVLAAVS
ncbi:sensor domain-containing diguanylate cyclase [Palleronia sp. LCG004]|uniref:GGDEF domain-containing protein n=1 Tax=Palleronia sp. LCG004 TaxID=3079304 RepID=UPI0029432DFD|nr:sensor domain-containing diguanylate cyclase [Palleronia sp. LCG004]WOI55895.1 sensor domain-containing diguanylate cyclase [Palleronia sp. LCG004]